MFTIRVAFASAFLGGGTFETLVVKKDIHSSFTCSLPDKLVGCLVLPDYFAG